MSGSVNALFKNEGPPKKARIEIIPLIDVIFFLLATFVLFTLSLNQTGGVRVDLPAVKTHEERNPENAVTISVTIDGAVAWNKDIITLTDLVNVHLPALKTLSIQQNRKPKVFVNADQNVNFTRVRYVIDEIRKQGIYNIFIETRAEAQK